MKKIKKQGIYDLNEKQQKLFSELKSIYKRCEKAGILFVNNYGSLHGYDKSIVRDYGNEELGFPIDERVENNGHGDYIKSVDSYADDTHYIHLTKKGIKIAKEEGLL